MKNLTIACFLLLFAGALTSCKKNIIVIPETPLDSLSIGLLAYYPFNNSGTDLSGKGNHVTYYANMTPTTDRLGKANSAFYFNGVNSYMAVADNVALRLNNTDITLSAWVKLDGYNTSFGNNILSKHITGADNGWAWGITGQGFSPTGVITYGPGGTSLSARGTKVINVNEWHMVTSTYNLTTKQLSIYIDGVLDNVTSNNLPSPNPNISTSLYIGRDEVTVATNGYFVKGNLDEIRIYNRLLSAKEVQKLYTYVSKSE